MAVNSQKLKEFVKSVVKEETKKLVVPLVAGIVKKYLKEQLEDKVRYIVAEQINDKLMKVLIEQKNSTPKLQLENVFTKEEKETPVARKIEEKTVDQKSFIQKMKEKVIDGDPMKSIIFEDIEDTIHMQATNSFPGTIGQPMQLPNGEVVDSDDEGVGLDTIANFMTRRR